MHMHVKLDSLTREVRRLIILVMIIRMMHGHILIHTNHKHNNNHN